MVSSQMVNNPSVQQNLPALRLADFYSSYSYPVILPTKASAFSNPRENFLLDI